MFAGPREHGTPKLFRIAFVIDDYALVRVLRVHATRAICIISTHDAGHACFVLCVHATVRNTRLGLVLALIAGKLVARLHWLSGARMRLVEFIVDSFMLYALARDCECPNRKHFRLPFNRLELLICARHKGTCGFLFCFCCSSCMLIGHRGHTQTRAEKLIRARSRPVHFNMSRPQC